MSEDELDRLLGELCEVIRSHDMGEYSEYGSGVADGLNYAVQKIDEYRPRLRELLKPEVTR